MFVNLRVSCTFKPKICHVLYVFFLEDLLVKSSRDIYCNDLNKLPNIRQLSTPGKVSFIVRYSCLKVTVKSSLVLVPTCLT